MTAIFFVTTKFTLLPRLEKYRKLILSMEIVLHCNVSNSVTDPKTATKERGEKSHKENKRQ